MSKAKHFKKQKQTPFDIVRDTNYLNLAFMVRIMCQVYGWTGDQLNEFLESYFALAEEIADKRSGVRQFVADTKELTGIDVKQLVDSIYRWR